MKKYYIYESIKPLTLVRETYVKKDAKRYEKQGFIVRSRTKPIKTNAKANINIARWIKED